MGGMPEPLHLSPSTVGPLACDEEFKNCQTGLPSPALLADLFMGGE